MTSARIIPVLLLKGRGLYKTRGFKNPVYIGDPINTVRIFNDKEVDEIILLDIGATRENRGPDFKQIEEIVSECFIPMAYGGGISTCDQAMRLFSLGVEKVVLNSHAITNPKLIEEIANNAGSQAVVIAIDARKPLLGKWSVYSHGATTKTALDPVIWAKTAADLGAGEIMITAIANEGEMKGYDTELAVNIAKNVRLPVIIHGGAGSVADLAAGLKTGATAAAAGSFFVFQGPHRAVLISYPTQMQLDSLQEAWQSTT